MKKCICMISLSIIIVFSLFVSTIVKSTEFGCSAYKIAGCVTYSFMAHDCCGEGQQRSSCCVMVHNHYGIPFDCAGNSANWDSCGSSSAMCLMPYPHIMVVLGLPNDNKYPIGECDSGVDCQLRQSELWENYPVTYNGCD